MYNEDIIDAYRFSSLEHAGEFIQHIRKVLGLTQQEVAEGCGFSVVSVSKFENGRCNRNSVAPACISNYILEQAEISVDEALEAYRGFCEDGKPFELKH